MACSKPLSGLATMAGFDHRTDRVSGRQDFAGKRLNCLQIGLGTFGTFVQNLTDEAESYSSVTWLLEAASDASAAMLAVGVEPVAEHEEKLRPSLAQLPNSALVQAAVGAQSQATIVYTVTHEGHEEVVRLLKQNFGEQFKERLEVFEGHFEYLQNMSCVGQVHPYLTWVNSALRRRIGVRIDMTPQETVIYSYSDLSRALNIGGTEVLIIDAEGHDCQILESMIKHCKTTKSWPDVIQFETMGHNDTKLGCAAEAEMIKSLQDCGYIVCGLGNDTQLVYAAALETEPRLQQWVTGFQCRICKNVGPAYMPFQWDMDSGMLCASCVVVNKIFGPAVWEAWHQLSSHCALKPASLATDGERPWIVDIDGRAFRFSDDGWTQVAPASDWTQMAPVDWYNGLRIWGLDKKGRIVHYRAVAGDAESLPDSAACRFKHLAPAGDGRSVWATDSKGQLRIYWTATNTWTVEPSEVLFRSMTVSFDASVVWAVDVWDRVWYRPGYYGSWENVPGHLSHLAVSGDGRYLWGVNHLDEVYYRAGVWGDWVKLPGKLKQVVTSHKGGEVWGLDVNSNVWLYKYYPEKTDGAAVEEAEMVSEDMPENMPEDMQVKALVADILALDEQDDMALDDMALD